MIDSRDVIARIEELSDLDESERTTEDLEELNVLQQLASEAGACAPDWTYGESLIRDSYLETYAQQLAKDCGMIPDDAKWPMTCIDWDQAARELSQDYTSVDFDGVTYWIR